jgi:two-component system, OmpR family, phosphate regulon sensor histidine kinase PhoR
VHEPDPVSRLREEIFATVSHELKTPLASIIGYAELLADMDDEDLSPAARRIVAIIQRNADRELRLVNDLLSDTWLAADPVRLTRSPVDLAGLVQSVVEEVRATSPHEGILLCYEPSEVSPVSGDPDRLWQVVENLVSNAVKFTPPGGRVDVRVRDGHGTAVLEVADTGMGVAEEARPRVFDRLYRAPEALERHIQGAGLGLSIVRSIVTAHQGWVEVQSAPGEGALFRVVLPVSEAAVTRAGATTRG